MVDKVGIQGDPQTLKLDGLVARNPAMMQALWRAWGKSSAHYTLRNGRRWRLCGDLTHNSQLTWATFNTGDAFVFISATCLQRTQDTATHRNFLKLRSHTVGQHDNRPPGPGAVLGNPHSRKARPHHQDERWLRLRVSRNHNHGACVVHGGAWC